MLCHWFYLSLSLGLVCGQGLFLILFPAIFQNSIWSIAGNLVFVEGRERMTKAEGEGGEMEERKQMKRVGKAEGNKEGRKEFLRSNIF